MPLKLLHLSLALFLIVAASCVVIGQTVTVTDPGVASSRNLLIGGIWQTANDQTINQGYAKLLDADYVPTYYEGFFSDPISVIDATPIYTAIIDPSTGATTYMIEESYQPTDSNGLTSNLLTSDPSNPSDNDHYDTIYAHSGGARTAVTALLYQDVTAEKLVLISPAKGPIDDECYYWELQKLLDSKIVKEIVVYQSEVDTPFMHENWQGRFDSDDIDGNFKIIPVSKEQLGGKTGNDAHKQMWETVLNIEINKMQDIETEEMQAPDQISRSYAVIVSEPIEDPLLSSPEFDMPSDEGPSGSDISDVGSLTPEQMDALIEQMQALGQTIQDYLDSDAGSGDDTDPGPGDNTQVEVSIWVHHQPTGGAFRGTTITIIDGAGNEIPVELDSNGKATVSGAPGTWTITASGPRQVKTATWSEVVSSGSAYADLYQKYNLPEWSEVGPVAGVGPLV